MKDTHGLSLSDNVRYGLTTTLPEGRLLPDQADRLALLLGREAVAVALAAPEGEGPALPPASVVLPLDEATVARPDVVAHVANVLYT